MQWEVYMLRSKVLRFLSGCALASMLVHAASAQQTGKPLTAAAASQTVQFNLFLPLQNSSGLDQLLSSLHTSGSPNYQQWLTPQAFHAQFFPNPGDISTATTTLASYGFTVTGTHSHGITVQGTAASVQKAFGVSLSNALTPTGAQKLIANGPIQMPAALSQLGAEVVAFSPAIRHHSHSRSIGTVPDNRYSPAGGYWFDDLKQAYSYPSYKALTGKGRTIGIVMANDFLDSDMAMYFGHEKLATPKIVRVPVDGGAPFDPNLSAEVTL